MILRFLQDLAVILLAGAALFFAFVLFGFVIDAVCWRVRERRIKRNIEHGCGLRIEKGWRRSRC